MQTLLASFLFLICSRAARSIALAQYRLKAWRITFLGNSSNAMTYFGSSLARMPIEHEPNRELICNLIWNVNKAGKYLHNLGESERRDGRLPREHFRTDSILALNTGSATLSPSSPSSSSSSIHQPNHCIGANIAGTLQQTHYWYGLRFWYSSYTLNLSQRTYLRSFNICVSFFAKRLYNNIHLSTLEKDLHLSGLTRVQSWKSSSI